jgi:hypothetical protein
LWVRPLVVGQDARLHRVVSRLEYREQAEGQESKGYREQESSERLRQDCR